MLIFNHVLVDELIIGSVYKVVELYLTNSHFCTGQRSSDPAGLS